MAKPDWAGCECSLNGKPAVVCGRANRFATVRARDGEGYEWSWDAVDRIMRRDQAFRS